MEGQGRTRIILSLVSIFAVNGLGAQSLLLVNPPQASMLQPPALVAPIPHELAVPLLPEAVLPPRDRAPVPGIQSATLSTSGLPLPRLPDSITALPVATATVAPAPRPQAAPATAPAPATTPAAAPKPSVVTTPAPAPAPQARAAASTVAPATSVSAAVTAPRPAGSPAARLPYTPSPAVATPGPTTTPTPTPSPAASPAASAAAVATPAPASLPATVSEVRTQELPGAAAPSHTVLAAQGKTWTQTMPGLGWLFTGLAPGGDGVVFLGSRLSGTDTVFSFRLERVGAKTLRFQRQDGSRSSLELREIRLEVMSAADLAKAEAERGAVATSTTTIPTVASPVRALTDPSLTLSPAAQAQNAVVTTVLTRELPSDATQLFAQAQADEKAGRKQDALVAYQALLDRHPSSPDFAEAMFRRASLLESLGERQRLREAFDLYVRLVREYPYSRRVEEARGRARYLERNFFSQR